MMPVKVLFSSVSLRTSRVSLVHEIGVSSIHQIYENLILNRYIENNRR